MKFLAENWVTILFVIMFVLMLTGRGGCCGSHGSHGGHHHKPEDSSDAQPEKQQVHAH